MGSMAVFDQTGASVAPFVVLLVSSSLRKVFPLQARTLPSHLLLLFCFLSRSISITLETIAIQTLYFKQRNFI